MSLRRKPRPAVADGVVISRGRILLVLRAREPELGKWAVPGGFLEFGETAEEAVAREVFEETGVKVKPLRITGVYSSPSRDPARQTVAIAFLCKPAGKMRPRGGDDAERAEWWPLSRLPKLAFDHGKIIREALAHK